MANDLWVVTGACGQLGRGAMNELHLRGLDVLGCDLSDDPLDTGDVPIRWLKMDLSQLDDGFAWPMDVKGVLHLAGAKWDQAFSVDTTTSLLRANLLALAGALSACRGHVQRFVHVSSISVYDPSIQGAISEEMPTKPKTPYGISKLLSEMACGIFAQSHIECEVVIIRLAQVYGPGTWKENAVYRLIEQAIFDRDLVLTCSPELARDYIHFDDARRALVAAALFCPAGVYNVGYGSPVTMGQIATSIANAVPGCHLPRFSNDTGEGLKGRYLSNRRFLAHTQFRPAVQLDQGIRKEVEKRLSDEDDLVSLN